MWQIPVGIERACTYQLKYNTVTFTQKMKHNTSREKPAERQMFKGTTSLESQSSAVTESEGCALQGNAKGNAQGDFDLMLRDPMGRQGDVSGMCWSPLPTCSCMMPDHKGEGTVRWGIPIAAIYFPLRVFSITHWHSSSPSNPVCTYVPYHPPTHHCCATRWQSSLLTQAVAGLLWPDPSLNWPGL